MKKFKGFLLVLMLFPLTVMAEMNVIERSIEAEKALYFFDEPTGSGRIIAFSCVSCPPVSLEYFSNIKVKIDGDVIDSAGLEKYSGYSATIFFDGATKTAIRVNVGEKSRTTNPLTTNSPPPNPPRRANNEK